ncbi:MAG: copper resistance protein B [Xanthomonadaceae bacterium]|jgi:copper resistance protein B|nr:copper resistance protein B [Xanthomonadaceae bacterium]
MKNHALISAIPMIALAFASSPAFAQSHDHSVHAAAGEDASGFSPMDHSGMDHSPLDSVAAPITPIPALTDADRAAAFPELDPHAMEHGSGFNSLIRINRMEAWNADRGTGQAWELRAWFGTDIDRLWLRSDGERSGGRTGSASLEVLYGRSVAPWWDVVAGVRHDFRPIESQTWAAIGVQGMAPYKFEISATAYIGEHGHAAAAFEIGYDLLLTNRLVLQPSLEGEFSLKQDAGRGLDDGLNRAEIGLRMRYEISRRFAPYIGIVHERRFSRIAVPGVGDDAGNSRDTRWVAGVRLWF